MKDDPNLVGFYNPVRFYTGFENYALIAVFVCLRPKLVECIFGKAQTRAIMGY